MKTADTKTDPSTDSTAIASDHTGASKPVGTRMGTRAGTTHNAYDPTGTDQKEPIFTRDFTLAFTAQLCGALIMYLLITTLTEYATSLGAAMTIAGFVSGIYVVGGLVSRMLSARGLERFGWKRTAMIALAITVMVSALYFPVRSVGMLLAVRFVHGLCFGVTSNVIMVMGTSKMPLDRFGEANGYFMLGPTLAVAVGPFAGGIVFDTLGVYGCFAAVVALSVISFVCVAPIDVSEHDPITRRTSRKDSKTASKDAEVQRHGRAAEPNSALPTPAPRRGLDTLIEVDALPTAAVALLCSLGYVAIMSFYRLYAAQTGLEREFSFFFIIYAVILLIVRPLAGRFQDYHGPNALCFTGIVLQAIGLCSIALAPCLPTIVLCAVCSALGYGTISSVLNAVVCNEAPMERRSYAVAAFWLCCDGGVGFGSLLLGAIVSAGGYPTMYCAAAAMTLLALPMFAFSRYRRKSHHLG